MKTGAERLTVPLAQLGVGTRQTTHGTKGPISVGRSCQCDVGIESASSGTQLGKEGHHDKHGARTVERIIESGRGAEEPTLEAVRKFLDTVNGVFPDVSEDGPRRKIIDSAFKMTEELAGTWIQAAEKIVKTTGEALAQPKTTSGSSK